MINLVEAQNILKGLTDEQLRSQATQPSGQVPHYMVLSEVQRRQDMRRESAATQPRQTVAEEKVREMGIASLPKTPQGAPGLPSIQKFQEGGLVVYRGQTMTEEMRDFLMRAEAQAARGAPGGGWFNSPTGRNPGGYIMDNVTVEENVPPRNLEQGLRDFQRRVDSAEDDALSLSAGRADEHTAGAFSVLDPYEAMRDRVLPEFEQVPDQSQGPFPHMLTNPWQRAQNSLERRRREEAAQAGTGWVDRYLPTQRELEILGAPIEPRDPVLPEGVPAQNVPPPNPHDGVVTPQEVTRQPITMADVPPFARPLPKPPIPGIQPPVPPAPAKAQGLGSFVGDLSQYMPDRFGGIEKQLHNMRQDAMGDPSRDQWRALAEAGFALAANPHQRFIPALAQAANVGMQSMDRQQAERRAQLMQLMDADTRLAQTRSDRDATLLSSAVSLSEGAADREQAGRLADRQYDIDLQKLDLMEREMAQAMEIARIRAAASGGNQRNHMQETVIKMVGEYAQFLDEDGGFGDITPEEKQRRVMDFYMMMSGIAFGDNSVVSMSAEDLAGVLANADSEN